MISNKKIEKKIEEEKGNRAKSIENISESANRTKFFQNYKNTKYFDGRDKQSNVYKYLSRKKNTSETKKKEDSKNNFYL